MQILVYNIYSPIFQHRVYLSFSWFFCVQVLDA